MNPERWQQISQFFHAARGLTPAERTAFLDEECADDSLRKLIEQLLATNVDANSFMESTALEIEARLLADAESDSVVGQTIGHYKIIAAICVGGMGEVYLAQDMQLGRKVALKLLPTLFTMDTDRVRRFQQEARAASALNHPNIITIYEIGEFDDRHFIVTEFIDGETVRRWISGVQPTASGRSSGKPGTPQALSEVLNIAIQTADALAAAHEAGIVHRDIKPENIMVRGRDGYVKVLDFGLAKLTEGYEATVDLEGETRAQVKTNPGMVMGTVGYMSPEQARAEKVDARTDIWSLGVVLYELLAGCPPFDRPTPSEVIASILEHEPPPLPRYARDVPEELERIVSKTLTKDREERYQTAKDLLVDLRRLKQRLEVDAAVQRTSQPVGDNAKNVAATGRLGEVTGEATAVASSTSRAVSRVKRFNLTTRGALIVLASLVTLAALAYFVYSRYEMRSRAGMIRSVAVLPFENQTKDPDSEYLSDGISESLINSLSQLPGIKVTARNSSFKYKGKNTDPQEVADALGVEAIMTGRVAQRGDTLIISVELVDARDKTQIWGEQYNRKLADLLAVQSEISSEIAQKLRLRLTTGDQEQLVKRETLNPQAYELLLKGRFYWRKGGTENRKRALEFFQQAMAVDPVYALAYVELSNSYDTLITNNELDPKEFRPKAEAAARRAVELDENLAEAHLAMAWIKMSGWDWAAAEREIKRAIELNPNLVPAHKTYSMYHRIHGKLEEAEAQLNRVRELDPLSYSDNQAVLARLMMFRQNDQALELAKKILELDPNHPGKHVNVGLLYARLGRYREAIIEFQEAIKLGDNSGDTQISLGSAYARAGEREKAREILKRSETNGVSPVALAILHLALGERDKAFDSLEAAYAAHDQQLIWLRGEFEFDQLHGDPRYEDLVRRVGLSD